MLDHAYTIAEIVSGAVILITATAFAFVYGRSKVNKDTIELSKDTIAIMDSHKRAQDEAIKALQDDAANKDKSISHLSGQIDVLKDIPLRKISESMEALSKSHADLTSYMTNHDEAVKSGVQQIIDHIDKKVK